MMKICILIPFILLSCSLCQDQKMLTPEEAIAIALKNNYAIRIARTAADIDKVNNTAGNAGILPTIGITGSDIYNMSNYNQQLSNDADITFSKADANSLNGSVA